MEKLYDRIDWHNNTTPALNETNLNRMSKALDDLDDRVVDIAGTVMETVPQVQEDLAEAQELLEDAEAISTHPPIIGQNGNWWTWDTDTNQYADSGVDAGVSLTIGETTTLDPNEDATVENVGTATDPILNFGIPKGAKGDTGSTGATPNITATATVDANVGTPSVNVTKSGTAENPSLAFAFSNIKGAKGDTGATGSTGPTGATPNITATATVDAVTGTPSVNVTQSGTAENPSISFAFHNLKGAKGDTGATGQTGPAGQGVPTGGTTGQVLKKKSGTNYDTEWADESGGGSGGHTIINSAGTDMTQRTGLQFSGLNVTDDNANNKTVVTLPTPDYVDEQFNSSTTYSKGMTCISGNIRYRYINSTATSGHRPPDTTYWEVLSVATQIKNEYVLLHSNKVTTGATDQTNTINNLNIDISQYKEIMLVIGLSENNVIYYFRGTQVYPVSLLGISSGNTTVRCDPYGGADYRFYSYIYISNAKKITLSSIIAYYNGSTFDVELRVYGIK